jgi:hypothetical protein
MPAPNRVSILNQRAVFFRTGHANGRPVHTSSSTCAPCIGMEICTLTRRQEFRTMRDAYLTVRIQAG